MLTGAYNQGELALRDRSVDFVGATIEFIPLKSSYTFDPDHTNGMPAASEISGVTGYTPGWASSGALGGRPQLGTKSIAKSDALDEVGYFAANPPTFIWGAGDTIGGFLIQKRGSASDATAVPLWYLPVVIPFATNGVPYAYSFDARGIAVSKTWKIVPVVDLFVRADSAVTPGTADSGQAAEVGGIAPDNVLGISGNALYRPTAGPTTTGTDRYYKLGSPNQRVRMVVRVNESTGGCGLTLYARLSAARDSALGLTTSSTGYYLLDSDGLTIYGPIVRAAQANDVWELDCNGSTIILRLNGVTITTVTSLKEMGFPDCGVGIDGNVGRIASVVATIR